MNGENVFLHAMAGSGKTTATRRVVQMLENAGKKVVVVAPSAMGALQISESAPGEYQISARTIHSQFAIAPYEPPNTIDRLNSLIYRESKKPIRSLPDVLIIDEISMLGASLLTIIESKLRAKNSKLMGGVQVIALGDMYQLPPVKDLAVTRSALWKQLNFNEIEFTVNRRYTDQKYFEIMRDLRVGKITDEDLAILNSRVIPPPANVPIIAPSHKIVNAHNHSKLYAILAQKHTLFAENTVEYISSGIGSAPSRNGYYNPLDAKLEAEQREYALKKMEGEFDRIVGQEITICIGAFIMIRSNISQEKRLVNGALGVVLEIGNEVVGDKVIWNAGMPITRVRIQLKNGSKHIIERVAFSYETDVIKYRRSQFPFVIAYAMTIDKSQGSTIDELIVDNQKNRFYPGQLYVALSRVRALDCVYLTRAITRSDILVPAF